MDKGTIVLVPFPFTDLSGQKVRPALVLYASKRGEDCVAAFITSSKHRGKSIFDVSLPPSAKNGIKVISTVKADKLATIQKKIVLGELGVLEAALLKEVGQKLRILFQL